MGKSDAKRTTSVYTLIAGLLLALLAVVGMTPAKAQADDTPTESISVVIGTGLETGEAHYPIPFSVGDRTAATQTIYLADEIVYGGEAVESGPAGVRGPRRAGQLGACGSLRGAGSVLAARPYSGCPGSS